MQQRQHTRRDGAEEEQLQLRADSEQEGISEVDRNEEERRAKGDEKVRAGGDV